MGTFWTFQNPFEQCESFIVKFAKLKPQIGISSDWHLKLNFHPHIFFLFIHWQGHLTYGPLNFTKNGFLTTSSGRVLAERKFVCFSYFTRQPFQNCHFISLQVKFLLRNHSSITSSKRWVGGLGQKMVIFDDLQYCKSSKRWVGGPRKVKNMMMSYLNGP